MLLVRQPQIPLQVLQSSDIVVYIVQIIRSTG